MKIGLYLGDLSPLTGGAFTFQDDICRVLMDSEEALRHSWVIYSNLSDDHQDTQRRLDIRWVHTGSERMLQLRRWVAAGLDFLPYLGSSLHYHGSFERSLRRQGVELVWFLTEKFHSIETPYIFTIWDLQHRVQPWFPEVASYGRWHCREKSFGRAVSRAAAIIVPNAAAQEELERFYHILPERIYTLSHPTPNFALEAPLDWGADVLQRHGLQSGYLFYPAQFWPHKNHINLIAAVKSLKEEYDLQIHLVLVGGDKGNASYVKSIVSKWGLAGQVHFLGFVSREDLIGLYRNAFALAYPTFFGPENLPPLEAFALGCPVIASRIRGSEEQLGDAALLVEPTDVEHWAKAVLTLRGDQVLRQKMIDKGHARAASWTAGDFARRVFDFIDTFERVRRCWPTRV